LPEQSRWLERAPTPLHTSSVARAQQRSTAALPSQSKKPRRSRTRDGIVAPLLQPLGHQREVSLRRCLCRGSTGILLARRHLHKPKERFAFTFPRTGLQSRSRKSLYTSRRVESSHKSLPVANESLATMIMTRNSDVRRLLVITYHFPPDGAIGGQRWAGLSKYLARLGWEVHILTAAAAGTEQPTPNVHRHFHRRRRTLNDVYRAAAGRLRQRSNGDKQPTPANGTSPRSFSLLTPVSAIRRILGSSMSLPDDGRGWVAVAAVAARELLRERKFDVVISSGPPHSAHFAGLAATVGRDAQFWIDMRDPWSATQQFGVPDDGFIRAERFMLRRLERLVFPRAARVIVNTLQFGLALGIAEPELKVKCLPNGVDTEHVPFRDGSDVEQGSISYVGTLYFGRNLSSVCAAMSQVLREKPEAAATLRLNVAGPMEPPHRRKFQEEIAAAGLTSVVKIHGPLPRAQALALLSRSHLSLVLAQNQPMQVPAKLYESVGLGVPTLVIAEETSAAALEARRIGAMNLDSANVDGLRLLFEDMLAGRIPTKIEPKTPISYAYLAQEWDELLRESLGIRTDAIRQPQAAPIGIL
jgi:glycosyltransferase involved in cell wall biosynthesis